jgi:GDP-4-dehydro-6-deoxy-D-mannose reductase
MTTAVVTGASGPLGRSLSTLLRAQGVVVVAWAGASGRAPATEGRVVDIRNRLAVAQAIRDARPDVIFHLAGIRHGPSDQIVATNVAGFANLIDGLDTTDRPRIVIAGSSAQYGGRTEPTRLGEAEAQEPETLYGATKAGQELLALLAVRQGHDVVCARLFNLIGHGQRPGLLAADVATQLANPEATEITTGPLDGTRDFVDYQDAATALAHLAESGEAGGVFNVCTGTATPLRHIVETLARLSRRQLPIVEQNAERTGPSHQVGDPARLYEATGWVPSVPLEQSLADLFAECLAYPSLSAR